MKYSISRSGNSWFVWREPSDIDILSAEASQSEAEIVAFALNAVATGKVLCTLSKQDFEDGDFYPHRPEAYDGPTDGVAL